MGRMRPFAFGAAAAVLISGMAMADIAPPPPDLTPTPTPSEAPADPAAAKAAALAIKESDIGIGNPDAPVKWIEYASAGCPHCADLTLKVLPALKADYIDSGKVYYVLRDFPLDNVAAAASVIARCLPKDQFYPFMDKIFANQAKWHGPDVGNPAEALKAIAAEVGLDGAGVDACLERQDILNTIVEGLKEADGVLKVTSTPTSFIGGETVVGTLSVDEFKTALDKALGVDPGMTPKPEEAPQPTPAPQ